MDTLTFFKTINYALCLILLILNTGALNYFLRIESSARFMKLFFVGIVSAIEIALIGILFSFALARLGVSENGIAIFNSAKGFLVLLILIATEIVLFLISRDRVK